MVEARTENIAIGAALAGLVLEVYVPSDRVGTHVTAGQPLFRVDDRHLKAQLKVAEAQLAMAEARLARLEKQPRPEELPPSLAKVKAAAANAARLQDQYERAKRLVRDGASSPQEEYVIRQREYEAAVHEQAQAQAEYDLLKAGAWKPDIEIAKAAVDEARAQVEQVKTEIARATVVAPVDGVVLQVNVRAGERVSDRDSRGPGRVGRHQHVPRPRRYRRAGHRALPTRGAGQGLSAGRDGSRDDDALRAGRAVCRAQDSAHGREHGAGRHARAPGALRDRTDRASRSTSASSWMCSSTETTQSPTLGRLVEGK